MSPQDTSYEKPSDLFYTASIYQKIAGVLAITGAVVATSMMVTWANTHDTDQAYLGGLNWGRLVFNWHPVLMITGMILCLISSLLMYRINELPKYMTKAMHATIHTAAIICVLTGLSAVVTGNNYTNHSYDYQYVPNLYSLHSLLGMSAMVLYFSNYLLAGFHFLAPGVKLEWKVAFKPNHVFVGVFTLFAATFAVLSGINELSNDVGCIYSVGNADWNPALNYHRLPEGCRLANGIGIMVFISVFFCAYALIGPGVPLSATKAVGPNVPAETVQSRLHANEVL